MGGSFYHPGSRDSQRMRRYSSADDADLLGGDPLFGSVFSLLNFGGADGSTTFTDAKGISWIAVGNAQIDTSLGYNTGLFDGTGDYIKTAATVNLVSGAFCIEQWLYMLAAPSGVAYIACQDDGASNSQNFQLYIDTSRALVFVGWASSARGSFWTFDSGATVVPLNTLCHVAVDYDAHPVSPTTRLFIGGALVGSRAGTHWAGAALPLTINSFLDGPNDESAAARYNGHMRTSRITAASRYNAAFTPPPPPFKAF